MIPRAPRSLYVRRRATDRWSTRRRLAFSGSLLVAGILALELIFGSWIFSSNAFWFLNVPRKLQLKHDTSALFAGPGISLYRRDAYGLRGDYGEPSRIDVLTIGGSTTNEGLVSEGETWTDILGQRLSERGSPLVVANAGVDGHSSLAHLRSFEQWFPHIPGLRPRYVVAYVGLNDVHVEAYEPYSAIVRRDPIGRLIRGFKNNAALFNLYRRGRSLLGPRVVHGAGNVAGPFDTERPATNDHEARYADRVAEYGARLRELERRIRTFGATPVFVTQPRGDYRWIDRRVYAASPAAMDQYLILQLFNRRTLVVCREAGAICIDLAAGLHFSDGDFYDVMHTTPQGSRKIGEYLAAELGQAL